MILNENVSLKKFNTMGVDVKARYFAEMTSPDDIFILPELSEKAGNRFLVLGEGSNILFTGDYDGLVIRNMIKGRSVISEDHESVTLRFGAGENWDQTVEYCVENNLWGIENLSLIPGTTGASPIQNIGAYGQEAGDSVTEVKFYDIYDNSVYELSNVNCRFGYRSSIFKHELKGRVVILSVNYKLKKKGVPELGYKGLKEFIDENYQAEYSLSNLRNAVISIRNSKLPDPRVLGNCGSFFKNPVISAEEFERVSNLNPGIKGFPAENGCFKLSAAQLIEISGFKGVREGDAGTSPNHALVLVNYGNASGRELRDLAVKIKHGVYLKTGVRIEEEVNII